MIATQPYDDAPAFQILSHLDPWDWLEAEATRGQAVTHLQLFAEWRAMQAARLASWVVYDDQTRTCPFALVALCHTGQRGVAGAAMLARDHRRFRRPLVELARLIRDELPGWARDAGVTRIEARAWAGHPRASFFLTSVGFRNETPDGMPGFGRAGEECFRQFAWTDPAHSPATALPRDPQHGESPCA